LIRFCFAVFVQDKVDALPLTNDLRSETDLLLPFLIMFQHTYICLSHFDAIHLYVYLIASLLIFVVDDTEEDIDGITHDYLFRIVLSFAFCVQDIEFGKFIRFLGHDLQINNKAQSNHYGYSQKNK